MELQGSCVGVSAQDFNFVVVPSFAPRAYTEPLRPVLGLGFSAEGSSGRVASHSSKAILSAYMSTWGSDLSLSELLGFHVNRQHASALNYTRGGLGAPIRQLSTALHQQGNDCGGGCSSHVRT